MVLGRGIHVEHVVHCATQINKSSTQRVSLNSLTGSDVVTEFESVIFPSTAMVTNDSLVILKLLYYITSSECRIRYDVRNGVDALKMVGSLSMETHWRGPHRDLAGNRKVG